MEKIINLKEVLIRDVESIPCPECDGFCDHVPLTKKEIKEQCCGRSYECCSRAFICRICKTRIVAELEAPDMEESFDE